MFNFNFSKKPKFYSSKLCTLVYYFIVYGFLTPYYRLVFQAKAEGLENIPEGKSVIFASNHASYHDPPLLSITARKHIAYMAKKELFEVPGLSQIIYHLGAFPVNRQKLEISTIKTAKHILKDSYWNMGIFPQGTRIFNGSLDDIKPGFGHLAKATKSTVIPVYIDIKRGFLSLFGKVTVKFGEQLPESSDPDEICENWKIAINKLKGVEYQPVSQEEASV